MSLENLYLDDLGRVFRLLDDAAPVDRFKVEYVREDAKKLPLYKGQISYQFFRTYCVPLESLSPLERLMRIPLPILEAVCNIM